MDSDYSKNNNTETPENKNPAPPRPYRLPRGAVFVVNGSVYKVTAARPNGKITAKFMGVRK